MKLALQLCLGFIVMAGVIAPLHAQGLSENFEESSPPFRSAVTGAACHGSTVSITANRAHDGSKSLLFSYSFSGHGFAEIIPISTVKVADTSTALNVSVWVYGCGQKDLTGCGLRLLDADNQTFQYWMPQSMTDGLDGTGWKLVQAQIDLAHPADHWGGPNNGKIHAPLRFFGFGFQHGVSSPAQGQFFLDDLRLSPKASITADSNTPLPIMTLTPEPLNPREPNLYLYPAGSVAKIDVTISGQTDIDAPKIDWSLRNFYSEVLAQGSTLLSGRGNGSFDIPVKKTGIYYISVDLLGQDGRKDASAETRIASLPPLGANARSLPAFYGVHLDMDYKTATINRETSLISRIGFQGCRFDCLWSYIEPRRGEWNWTLYDQLINALVQKGVAPLPIVCYSALWASADEQANAPHASINMPPVPSEYAAYATTLVQRYKGRVNHWEIWNEPNNGFWLGTTDQYAALFDTANAAIHAADPMATVLNGGFAQTGGHPGFESAWMKDVHSRPDIFAFHSHMGFPLMLSATTQAKREMADADWKMPVWIDEAGFSSYSDLSERDQAIALVKKMSYAPSAGLSGYVLYALRNRGSDLTDVNRNWGLTDNDFTPKASLVAVSELLHVLAGERFIRRIAIAGEPDVYALVFGSTDGHGGTVVLWSEADAATPLYFDHMVSASHVALMGDVSRLPMRSGLVGATAGSEPQYILFSGSPRQLDVAEKPIVFNSPLYAAPLGIVPMQLTVHNPLAAALHGDIALAAQGGWSTNFKSLRVDLPAKGSHMWSINVKAPPVPHDRQNLLITLTSPSLPGSVSGIAMLRSAVVVPHKDDAASLGDFSQWKSPAVDLGPDQFVSLYEATPAPDLQYHGKNDCSAEVYLSRVPLGLRVAVRVHDDVFAQDEPPGAEWQGDSIQFAIALSPTESYEWIAALTKSGPIAELDVAPPGVKLGPLKLPESIVRNENDTLYDLIIPTVLPGGRVLPDHFEFDLIVNDNDGHGRKGWLEWTPGIGRSKDTTQFQPIEIR